MREQEIEERMLARIGAIVKEEMGHDRFRLDPQTRWLVKALAQELTAMGYELFHSLKREQQTDPKDIAVEVLRALFAQKEAPDDQADGPLHAHGSARSAT
jgi:hypothetical protein